MIIDLTHKLNNQVTVYPGTPKPKFNNISTILQDGFAEMSLSLTTHTGTHIDAPSHIIEGAKAISNFEISTFIGKAIVIDCVSMQSIELSLLKQHTHQIEKIDFVLFRTGWESKWATEDYFSSYPCLTKEASLWLTSFELKGIGFDTISVDQMDDPKLVNHHILLRKEILIIENLTNLGKLPKNTFDLYSIPLNIDDGDAAPARVFVITQELNDQ